MAEPLTTAKVVLKTTKGNLEIELWAKEIPKTSKIFIQNCIDKKYIGQCFNRISKDFLIQSDSNQGSNSEDNKLEKFPRLKFNRRGLLGASSGTNGDSFFITYKETPQLNSTHTMFGKIVGDTHYTVVSIHDGELKRDLESPVYPVEIVDCEVIIPYFTDLKEKEVEMDVEEVIESKKPKKEKKKNKIKLSLNLEDDDEIVDVISKKIPKKAEAEQKVIEDVEEAVEKGKEGVEEEEEEDMKLQVEVENKEIEASAEEDDGVGEIHQKVVRDPEIDSDYDPYLDLSDEEKLDPKLIYTHTFKSQF